VDGDGRKMSKSQGNVVAPQEVIKTFGADILRLWVVASDYNEDVRISREILKNLAEAYRKVRNTARFLLGNLYDFEPKTDRLQWNDLLDIDRWALYALARLQDDVTKAYDDYAFYIAFQRIYKFCNEDMSSFYLDILKDRLYTAGKNSKLRRSAQTALHGILMRLVKFLAPFLPFTAEEIYRCAVRTEGDDFQSVHLSFWPGLNQDSEDVSVNIAQQMDPEWAQDFDQIFRLRPAILKALEEKRADGVLGSSLEARVRLSLKDAELYRHFARHAADLKFIFIVSEMELAHEAGQKEPFVLEVARAKGKKCARCWNYTEDVDGDAGLPGLCGRCVVAVKENA
jgi:isoleucyl-tRNA synthetase